MTKSKNYELMEILGTGSFGETWLARVVDPELVEELGVDLVAIKIPLSKHKERDISKEAGLVGALSLGLRAKEARHIVKYYSTEIFDNKLVITMQYVDGGNLRKLLGRLGRGTTLNLNDSINITEGILSGLDVIHKKHFIHRDIKPENILMNGSDAMIADFGTGRILDPQELASTIAGTLYYASPELLFAEGTSFNTDIWSVGILFYEMLFGRFPFGITVKMPPGKVTRLIADNRAKLVFPDEIPIPEDIKAIITKCLERNPNFRYKTAHEVIDDLQKYKDNNKEQLSKEPEELKEIAEMMNDFTRSGLVEKRLLDVLSRHPRELNAYLYLGELYNRAGNYEKAIDVFTNALKHHPANAKLHWDLAITQQKRGMDLQAIASLQKALQLGLEPSTEKYARIMLQTLQEKAGK